MNLNSCLDPWGGEGSMNLSSCLDPWGVKERQFEFLSRPLGGKGALT